MRKVGRLVDKYLTEISPDHGLGVSRFLAVAESLPDSARDCYDGVYRALDIYLEVINTSFCSITYSEHLIQKKDSKEMIGDMRLLGGKGQQTEYRAPTFSPGSVNILCL
jgi:hypothetical protein